MKNLINELNETTLFLKKITDFNPNVGIVLGTGLSGMTQDIEITNEIDYSEIPNFPISTVESHKGKLIFGHLSNKKIIAMQGRFHYYEGYSMQEITFPIRVMKQLGASNLVISNACGSLNPLFKKGDLMLLDDYINLLGTTPLVGEYSVEMGARFPDMSEPFSQKLIKLAEEIALNEQIQLHKGIYAAMCGPCLETRAEYRFLRAIGADAIGMSTIPETIVAKQVGLQTIGISILTDECYPECLQPVTLDEIIKIANEAEPKLTVIVKKLIEKM